MPRWLSFLPLALLVALAALFGAGLIRDPSALPSNLIDRPMPALALQPLSPEERAFANADLEGRVTLINVFGSWCVSCLSEHAQLLEIASSGEAALLGLNWRDQPGAGRAWLDRHGDPYLMTGADIDSRAAISLGVTGAPETFVVDAEGRIRYKHVGPITPEIWRGALRPLVRSLEREANG